MANQCPQVNAMVSRLTLDSKSILARLLASENIIVEHQASAQTAYFDTVNRRLVFPVWKNIDEDVYDLFVGHEVGHAIFTPSGEKVVLNAIDQIDPNKPNTVKQYLNIVEDARIERLMQEKFPGLSHSFRRGYRKMYEIPDLLMKENAKNPKLPTIDKLNLRCKIGFHAEVDMELKPFEVELYHEMMSTKTFADTVRVAKRIYMLAKDQDEKEKKEEAKNNAEKQKSQQRGSNQDGTPSSGDGDAGESNESQENTEKSDSKNKSKGSKQENLDDGDNFDFRGGDEGGSEKESEGDNTGNNSGDGENSASSICENEEGSEKEKEGDGGEDSQKVEESSTPEETQIGEAPNSLTEGSYTKMVDSVAKEQNSYDDIQYAEIPSKKIDRVCPYSKVISDFANLHIAEAYLSGIYEEWKAESKNYINMLHKDFELKKSADLHSRSMQARTGSIDPNRLHGYKFSEDIFKRITNIRSGKNHGLFMLVDWSGSMSGDPIYSTIKQVLGLVAFCKKANIPFEVYAFTDRLRLNYTDKKGSASKDLVMNTGVVDYTANDPTLVQWFTNSMSNSDYNKNVKNFLHMAHVFSHFAKTKKTFTTDSSGNPYPPGYDLGGTPLNDSIVLSFHMVPEFQKKNNIQIVNFVLLTDGEDSRTQFNYSYVGRVVIRDKKTRSQVCCNIKSNRRRANYTIALIKLLKSVVGCNTVGFYLIESHNGKNVLASIMGVNRTTEASKVDTIVSTFKKQNFIECFDWGYDSYFIVPSDDLESKLDAKDNYLSDTLKGKRLTTAFVRNQMKKRVNRVLIGRFVNMIAKNNIADPKKNFKGAEKREIK